MTIGEILDRAISTYVRRFVPLFVLLAITTIPAAALEVLSEPAIRGFNDALQAMNHLPPADSAGRTAQLMLGLRQITPLTIVQLFVIPGLLSLLSRNALFVYANGLFDGVTVTIGAAYRSSFPKWATQVVAAIAFAVIACAVIGALFVVSFIVLLLFALVLKGIAPALLAVVMVILVVPVAIVTFVALALLNVVWELTSIGVAIEGANPFRALGNAFRRTLDRPLIRRTVGVALAYTVVEFAGSFALFAAIALVRSVVHSEVINDVLSALVGMLIGGVLGLFMIAYARDLRMRREGFDLLLAAQASPAVP